MFTAHTLPAAVRNHGPVLTEKFINKMKRMVETPRAVYEVEIEHPYISEEDDAAVKALQAVTPGALPAWYYIPA